jgi:hypothetical protein
LAGRGGVGVAAATADKKARRARRCLFFAVVVAARLLVGVIELKMVPLL